MQNFVRTPQDDFQADKPQLHVHARAEPLGLVTCVAATSSEWNRDELHTVRWQHHVCHPGHLRCPAETYLTAAVIVAIVVAARECNGAFHLAPRKQRP
jgi:hypothetical protein